MIKHHCDMCDKELKVSHLVETHDYRKPESFLDINRKLWLLCDQCFDGIVEILDKKVEL